MDIFEFNNYMYTLPLLIKVFVPHYYLQEADLPLYFQDPTFIYVVQTKKEYKLKRLSEENSIPETKSTYTCK